MVGRFERVNGGVTAHEVDHGALDGGIEAEMTDDIEIESGRVLAGAGGDDDVRDAATFFFSEREFV